MSCMPNTAAVSRAFWYRSFQFTIPSRAEG